MKPAIWTDALADLEPEDAVERLTRIGWKNLELADKHWRDIDKRDCPEKGFEGLRRLCERLGVSVPQMHGPMFNVCEEPQKLKEHMGEAKRALRWAGVLGVRWVVLHPGSGPMVEDEEVMEEVRRQNLDSFLKLTELGRSLNVGIAVENGSDDSEQGRRNFGATPPELVWLAQNTDPEWVGICWDTGHANLQRLDQYRAIKALGKDLVATHIDDNDGSGDQHLLPFEGNVDWKAVMCALREVGYEGLFDLEIGGSIHKVPLEIRDAELRYVLELAEALVKGHVA